MKKIGVPVQNDELPHGCSVRYNIGREQPYTLWVSDETIKFFTTLVEAVSFAKTGEWRKWS